MNSMSAGTMAGKAELAQQKLQETPLDRATQRQGEFQAFSEDNMPNLPSRFLNISILDNLTSYLGSRNPFGKAVDPKKDEVWFFDATAYQPEHMGGNPPWESEVVAAYFAKYSGDDIAKVAADLAEKLGFGHGSQEEATVAKRLESFLDTILPAHHVNVKIANDKTSRRLGPSGRDGLSSDLCRISGSYRDGDEGKIEAQNIKAIPGTVTFKGATGWGVISDIDDTIKVTMTSSPTGILQSTFVDKPQPTPGMVEFYKHIDSRLQNPAWWYLSASPYNLHDFLKNFRDTYYPHGQLILREASWMNLAGFLANLSQGTQAYKVDRMKKVQRAFPRRKFVCIGDSTQSDPEAYGEMARTFPGWIKMIFIRKVTGVAEVDDGVKNTDERFSKAFEGVDVPWTVFEDPKVLYEKIDGLVKSS